MKKEKLFLSRSIIYWLIFSAGLLFLILIQYYGLAHFNYIVPPGDDPLNHLGAAQSLIDRTQSIWDLWKAGAYPPGYHLFIAKISLLLHADPLKVILWTYPAILVLAGLAIFFLTYVAFGPTVALVTFFLYSFTTRTPLQLLNDGGYPNLVAASIFLPTAIAFFLLAAKSVKLRRIVFSILCGLFAFLVLFTHHISTFYLLGVFFLSIPLFLITKAKQYGMIKFFSLFLMYLVLLALMFYAYQNSAIFAPARSLASMMIQSINHFPFFKIVSATPSDAIFSIKDYPGRIGRLVVPFGFLGLILLPSILKNELKKYSLPLIILISWAVFLLVGSRLTFLLNPERMARDLAFPLSILAGATIYYLWLQIKRYSKYALLPLIVIILFLAYSPTKDRIRNAFRYEPMVRFTSADYKVVQYINEHPGKIMFFGSDNFVPHFLNKKLIIVNLGSDAGVSDAYLSYFDYLYIIDEQVGWVSPGIQFGLAEKYMNNLSYKQVLAEESPVNKVYLFERKRP